MARHVRVLVHWDRTVAGLGRQRVAGDVRVDVRRRGRGSADRAPRAGVDHGEARLRVAVARWSAERPGGRRAGTHGRARRAPAAATAPRPIRSCELQRRRATEGLLLAAGGLGAVLRTVRARACRRGGLPEGHRRQREKPHRSRPLGALVHAATAAVSHPRVPQRRAARSESELDRREARSPSRSPVPSLLPGQRTHVLDGVALDVGLAWP